MRSLSIVREKMGWTARCCHTWPLTEISLAMLSRVAHKWRCIFVNKHLWLDSENEIIFSELRTCKQVIGAILYRQSCSVCLSVTTCKDTVVLGLRAACLPASLPEYFLWKCFQLLGCFLIIDWHADMCRFYTTVHSANSRHCARHTNCRNSAFPFRKQQQNTNCTWCTMITELQNYIPSAVTVKSLIS